MIEIWQSTYIWHNTMVLILDIRSTLEEFA